MFAAKSLCLPWPLSGYQFFCFVFFFNLRVVGKIMKLGLCNGLNPELLLTGITFTYIAVFVPSPA